MDLSSFLTGAARVLQSAGETMSLGEARELANKSNAVCKTTGEVPKSNRAVASALRSTYNELSQSGNTDAAAAVADVFVDKTGKPAWQK